MNDYKKAKKLGLIGKDRWGEDIDHHPMSKRLMDFLAEHDIRDYKDHFCWKTGGDGDNGETLMYEMDAFFELLDEEEKSTYPKEIMEYMNEAMLALDHFNKTGDRSKFRELMNKWNKVKIFTKDTDFREKNLS